MERYSRKFSYFLILGIGLLLTVPQGSVFAFHTTPYQYEQGVITDDIAILSTSTIQSVLRITSDIASHTYTGDVDLIDFDKKEEEPFQIITKASSSSEYDRESFYTYVDEAQQDNSTVVTIDTQSEYLQTDRVDFIVYTKLLSATTTIETSTDNNTWIYRGEDYMDDKKTWITYGPTTDRFIRITIPTQNISIYGQVEVSGNARYILFNRIVGDHYALYYGDQLMEAMANDTLVATDTSIFSNELKLTVRSQNPDFVDLSKNENDPGDDILAQLASIPYTQPIFLSIISVIILVAVGKILEMEDAPKKIPVKVSKHR